jgi:hypothetical protein
MIVCWLAACALSIWLACGASCFLVLGALVRFGLPAARRFFSWLAALSLDLACLRCFLPGIGALAFGLVLRFVFFLGSRRSRFCLLFLCASWRVCVCVCVCLRPLSRVRALAYSARALFHLQRGYPCFEAKRARMSYRAGNAVGEMELSTDSTSSSSSHIQPLKTKATAMKSAHVANAPQSVQLLQLLQLIQPTQHVRLHCIAFT